MECVKTCLGRVVYRRKTHFFSVKDVIRIVKSIIGYEVFLYYLDDDAILEVGRLLMNKDLPGTVFEYQGGSFGGAGTTRNFIIEGKLIRTKSSKLPSIILLCNKKLGGY